MPFILPASKAYLALGLAGFRSAQDNPIIEKGPGPCAYKKPNRVGIYEIPRNWKSRFSRNGKERNISGSTQPDGLKYKVGAHSTALQSGNGMSREVLQIRANAPYALQAAKPP